MSHANPAGSPPSAQGGGEVVVVDAGAVVYIVVSCPERGSLKPDGSGPYEQEVMTKLMELQGLGRIKIAFDRAGTSNANKEDEKAFRAAATLQESGQSDMAKKIVIDSKWFQTYTGGVKKFLAAEAQGFDGTQVILCIDGGTITQVEQQEMPRILLEA